MNTDSMARQPIGRPPTAAKSVRHARRSLTMILATTQVEDVDRFLDVFSTKGAEKRAQHGSKGSPVFRDPAVGTGVGVLSDGDETGWAAFVSDPDVPPILKAAGHVGKPQ